MRGWLTGVVTSAAWSSRRSSASFARIRAARACARGVVKSCWTGRDWQIGVDAELGIRPGACFRGGLGVVRADVDADADISADAKDARVMSGDILLDLNVWDRMTADSERRRERIGEVSGGFYQGVMFRCGLFVREMNVVAICGGASGIYNASSAWL